MAVGKLVVEWDDSIRNFDLKEESYFRRTHNSFIGKLAERQKGKPPELRSLVSIKSKYLSSLDKGNFFPTQNSERMYNLKFSSRYIKKKKASEINFNIIFLFSRLYIKFSTYQYKNY